MFKKRPALVLARIELKDTIDFILVQVTSKNQSKKNNPSIKIQNRDSETALPLDSYVLCHKLFTANEAVILSSVTRVSKSFVKKVIKKVVSVMEVK